MSVLCCRIPHFLISLAQRQHAELVERPFALLGVDERVCAVSPSARQQGVRPALSAQQALTHCPDLVLRPVDVANGYHEQAAFLATLAQCGLPVETLDWGAAYVDLQEVAERIGDAQALAAELGRQVRKTMGEALQPALGGDSVKFTARAAALQTAAGRMRLVGKEDEVAFLGPLPITMLPLSPAALKELQWLGIHTLAQFVALPVVGVQQRFGKPGRLAQRWAQGRDERPVRATVKITPEPVEVDLDPPAAALAPVVRAAMAALRLHLQALQDRLEGYRRLRLEACFCDGSTRAIDIALVEPISQADSVQQTLAAHLGKLNWPNALIQLRIFVLETGELSTMQLALFPVETSRRTALTALAGQLAGRFGPIFLGVEFSDPTHPIPARRFRLNPLA